MKKFIIAVIVAACLALCAAVWPQGNAVEETPQPTQEIAVNTPEVPVAAPKDENKVLLQTEKENTESRSRSRPWKPSLSQRQLPRQHLLSPKSKYSRYQNQPLPQPLSPSLPRRRRSLTRSPVTWSMYPASVGWKARAKAQSFMMT